MADVPHQLVARRPEQRVEGDRQLDDAEPRADVCTGARAVVDETGAHLVGERAELVAGEGAQVGGRLYTIEQRHG